MKWKKLKVLKENKTVHHRRLKRYDILNTGGEEKLTVPLKVYSTVHLCKSWRMKDQFGVVIHQHSRKLLKMDILMSETCWAHNKWNKIASFIKLVFHSSTITVPLSAEKNRNPVLCYFGELFNMIHEAHISVGDGGEPAWLRNWIVSTRTFM